MTNEIKNIMLGIAPPIVLATILGIGYAISSGKQVVKKVASLEQELSICSNKVAIAQLERDNFRRELIKNGNPEGFVLNGDAIGNYWYERNVGDILGGFSREYLDCK